MTSLHDLNTPCLVLDRGTLDRNIARMQARYRETNVTLRPHMKTAKCIEVARRAATEGSITVSSFEEVRYFREGGFDDILLAVCLTPAKFKRFMTLGEGINLTGIVDSVDIAKACVDLARPAAESMRLLIEIDCGEGRTGCDPKGAELLAIAQTLDSCPTIELGGVLTHAGQSYDCRTTTDIKAVAEQERAAVTHAAQRLRDAGHPCPVVSAGSTPTAIHATNHNGLTEMRPGVYMFGDLFQTSIGSIDTGDIAVSVLAEVISTAPKSNRIIIDAGGLALSKDLSAETTENSWRYGRVCDLSGQPIKKLMVNGVHQEHGEIHGTGLKAGDRVRILPNHICMTAAAHATYHVVEGQSPEVHDTWSRTSGW